MNDESDIPRPRGGRRAPADRDPALPRQRTGRPTGDGDPDELAAPAPGSSPANAPPIPTQRTTR